MNERDERAMRAGPRDLVDQPDAVGFETIERRRDVVHAQRDVMKPGATPGEV